MPSSGFSVVIAASDKASGVIDGVNKRISAMRAPAERVQKSLSKFADVSGLNAVGKGFASISHGALDAMRSVARCIEPLAAITGAVSLAGMVRLVQVWGQFGSQLGFAAQRIGITASQLQSLQGAAALAGASSGSLTSGLQNLGQTMYDAVGGRAPEAAALMNQLGVAFDDGTKHARKVTDVLPQLADKIAGIKDPFTQARVATALFGGAAEDLLPFLRKGSAGIAEYTAKAQRYGVLNDAAVAGANRMRESWAGMDLAVTGLSNSIAEKLAPIVSPLLDQMSNWIAANREWLATNIGDAVKGLADWLKQVDFKQIVTDVKDFARHANDVAQSLGGWKNVLEGIVAIKIASWASGAIGPLTGLIRLLAIIPGSGVTAEAVGGAIALTGAGIGDKDANPQARFRVSKPAGPHGAGGTLDTDNKTGPASNWIDRQLQAIGIEGTPQTSAGPGTAGALSYFQSHGWTKNQAAGIVANLQAESGLRPNLPGDGGAAYGAAQWHKDRQDNFKKWAGHDIRGSSLAEQYGFVNYELTKGTEQGAGRRLRGATNADDAGAIVSRYYERPAAKDEAAAHRGAAAAQIASAAPATGGVKVDTHVTITDKRTTSTSRASASGIATAATPRVETSPVYA